MIERIRDLKVIRRVSFCLAPIGASKSPEDVKEGGGALDDG